MELKKLIPLIKLSGKTFKEKTTEIEVLHAGKWEHPQYGTIEITEEDIDKFVDSFNANIRKVDLAIDQEHMPEKGAAGWYRTMEKVVEGGKTKLKATIEWTTLGAQLIKDGIFKYFSPEFDFEYEDPETQLVTENVLIGGALTNRPYFKSLAPVTLSEKSYASFSSKKKKKGGEKNMTKKELKAKLVADSEFTLGEKASDKEVKMFEEVKAEVTKEAEDAKKLAEDKEEKKKKELEAKKKKELEDKKKNEGKFISATDHTKQMNELRSQMGVVEKKLRFKEVTAEVDGLVFSESNSDGVLLPKNKDAAVELLMSATPKIATLFMEFMEELPAVSKKLFVEEGSGEEGEAGSDQIQTEATKLVDDKKANSYGEAIKMLQSEKPELFEEKKK